MSRVAPLCPSGTHASLESWEPGSSATNCVQEEDVTCKRGTHSESLLFLFLGLQERKETIRGVYSVIDQLSRTHLNTLERLIFHLVR